MGNGRVTDGAAGALRLGSRFEPRDVLGSATFLAHDTQLGRTVVLKRVRGASFADRLGVGPHPNVAFVRHEFIDGVERIAVMDHVDGTPVAEINAATVDDVLGWLGDVAAGLEHLHGATPPVAHGDLKASNVVVARASGGPRAVLVDCGATDATPEADVGAFRFLAHRLLLLPGRGGRARRLRRALRRRAGDGSTATSLVRALVRADDRFWARERRRARVAAVAAAVLLAAGLSTLAVGRTQAPLAARPSAGTSALERSQSGPLALATTDPAPASVTRLVPIDARVPSATPVARAPVLTARPRIGVYMPSAEFGEFNVYTLGTGSPEHQYRNVGLVMFWTHIATLDDGWLFFYRASLGDLGTAPVERDGLLGLDGESLTPERGWTHVAGAGRGVVWLYGSNTGAVRVLRYRDGFHIDDDRHELASGYDLVVGLGAARVLHYESATGRGVIASVGDSGGIVTREVLLPRGWTAIAATGGHVLGVNGDGNGSVVAVGDGDPKLVRTVDLRSGRWSAAVGYDRGVIVYSVTGSAILVEIDRDGQVGRLTPWIVPPTALLATIT